MHLRHGSAAAATCGSSSIARSPGKPSLFASSSSSSSLPLRSRAHTRLDSLTDGAVVHVLARVVAVSSSKETTTAAADGTGGSAKSVIRLCLSLQRSIFEPPSIVVSGSDGVGNALLCSPTRRPQRPLSFVSAAPWLLTSRAISSWAASLDASSSAAASSPGLTRTRPACISRRRQSPVRSCLARQPCDQV